MFKSVIDRASSLLTRIEVVKKAVDEGKFDSLSMSQHVPYSEIFGWFDSCSKLISEAFGEHSEQMQQWQDERKRLDDIRFRETDNQTYKEVNSTIREIFTMRGLLTSFQDIYSSRSKPETPTSHFHFTGTINGPVNAGGTVGKQIYNQNNNDQNPDFNQTLIEIKYLLENLEQDQSAPSHDKQIKIIETEFQEIKNKEPAKWQRWMTWLEVAFAGGVEAAKAFNPWVGIPIESVKKLYEVYTENQKKLPE
ncbi:MAG: hypothetical protein EWV76_16855 [Microcystis novacekii Mn_MB_F_20050700_S1]|uniref:Uncharacterized protein n=1 Tax=Microcystis novacekii Mn_MB_F_20050700_S1D TaxID=2486266 RepID=A0A552ITY2_9CHRO|nr:MAG: hypothetical protein EWV76_16855 [Microcystis novacekii Mn_MB_F_20050700_S1]TRU86927.1 MAG: hypothetical protein EWV54_13430 [Microcystis novacekii Mn_MB_F_20050700_S1D]